MARCPFIGYVGVGVEMVGEYRFVPGNITVNTLGVRVEQKFRRVAAVSLTGRPWAMHAEAVALPRFHPGKVPMPAVPGDLWQICSCFPAALVEQAQLDTLRHFGKSREAIRCACRQLVRLRSCCQAAYVDGGVEIERDRAVRGRAGEHHGAEVVHPVERVRDRRRVAGGVDDRRGRRGGRPEARAQRLRERARADDLRGVRPERREHRVGAGHAATPSRVTASPLATAR